MWLLHIFPSPHYIHCPTLDSHPPRLPAVLLFLPFPNTSKWKISLPPCVTFKLNTIKVMINCTVLCCIDLVHTVMLLCSCLVILFGVWLCTNSSVHSFGATQAQTRLAGIWLWSNSWSVNRRYKDICLYARVERFKRSNRYKCLESSLAL